MTSVVVDVADHSLWATIDRNSMESLFSSLPWTQAVARTYGFTVSAAVQTSKADKASALLFSRVSDVRGERIVSGPFCDYCDPLAGDLATWRDLVAPLIGQGVPITLRCLRNSVPLEDERFHVAGRAAWHGIDLTRTGADLWTGLSGSARQNIRKAKRLGVTVREGCSLDDLRLFFGMHCQVRKAKYRLLPQPFTLFEALHEAFSPGNRIVTLLAEQNGTAVAGVLFLEWRDTLYFKFSASVEREACPNDLLVWEGIGLGQRRGLARLDFGASDYDQPGLLRYKAKFATEQREIVRLRWRPPGYYDARAEEAGRALSRVTDLFTRPEVPEVITREAGEVLYGLFC